MKQLKRRKFFKSTVLILSCLLAYGSLLPIAQDQGQDQDQETIRLDGLFRTAKIDFQKKDYHGVIRGLELILSYFEDSVESNRDRDLLKARIYLLLGAAFEHRGQKTEATQNYRLSKEIFDAIGEPMELRGVDLGSLELLPAISGTQSMGKKQVIQRPAFKPKKKKRRIPLLLIAATIALGTAAYFLLIKEKKEKVDPNFDTNTLHIEYLMCPESDFMMGDNLNEGDADELPVHPVHLSTFRISKYEITFRQYDLFLNENHDTNMVPDDGGFGRGDIPVMNISYGEAQAFCDWLSRRTGKTLRLPTEAEWEYAARGTDGRRYPWGNSPPDCTLANYDCDIRPHPVGSHPAGASAFQVQDMAGNVAEWCLDRYSSSFYQYSPINNPVNNSGSDGAIANYVIRGGSYEGGSDIRAANREYQAYGSVSYKSTGIGFRIVWVD